jgi:hypothetical protein
MSVFIGLMSWQCSLGKINTHAQLSTVLTSLAKRALAKKLAAHSPKNDPREMRADYLSRAEEVLAEKQSQHCTTRLKGDGRQQTVFDTEHCESGSPFKPKFFCRIKRSVLP